MSTWILNNHPPEYYGLTVMGGQFNSGSASNVKLAAAINFDAAEKFTHGQAIAITRDGAPFFKGKVRAIPKHGSDSEESQQYVVEDVWAELERLTYQEPWMIRQSDYAGIVYSPSVVLGMNSAGDRITVGQQIEEVLNFAVAQGLALTVGDVPAGMMLWPTEVTGQSCATIIRDCLRYYPDWIPWIDHASATPTFNVTPRGTASQINLDVSACSDLSVSKTHDRVPAGVRIIYQTAGMIGGEVYRTMAIDQYPAVSTADLRLAAGSGVLVTTVELAGMKMQIQKQQVKTRTLPTSSDAAKAYLKIKFPAIADVVDGDFSIPTWTTAVIPDDATEADLIDSKLPRLPGSTRSELPRELVKGAVAEWMQKKVGKVLVEFTVRPGSGASAETLRKLATLPPNLTVVATNAITKVYQGVSGYAAADSVPTGIAQAYHETLASGCYFDGSATLIESETEPASWHGCKLNLTGGANSEWSSMGAPIHSVYWDADTGRTELAFGPNPDFAVQDFVEFLRLLNRRQHSTYTMAERTGDTLGAASGISAKGDSIGNYDTPETVTGSAPASTEFVHPFKLTTSLVDGAMKFTVSTAHSSITDGTNGDPIDLSSAGFDIATSISATKLIILEATVSPTLDLSNWTLIASSSSTGDEVSISGDPPAQSTLRLVIGKVTVGDGVATPWQALYTSMRISHAIVNGLACKVFEAAPTHPDKI